MPVNFNEICNLLVPQVTNIPTKWDGRTAILEMRNANDRNWKQMEWIGFHFEFLCRRFLSDVLEMPCPTTYGNVSFDGFLQIPWDFKAHAEESSNQIVINDIEAITNAVRQFEYVGVIIASGSVTYDNDTRDFKRWHDELKGGISNYERERIARNANSRRRKVNMQISKILFVRIDEELLANSGRFQENFRNADGALRRAKMKLNLEEIDNNIEHIIDCEN